MAFGRGARLLELIGERVASEESSNGEASAASAFPARPVGRGGRGMLILQSLDANVNQQVPPRIEELYSPRQPSSASSILSRMAQFSLGSRKEDSITNNGKGDEKSRESSLDEISSKPVTFRGEYGTIVPGTCNYIRLNVEPGKGVFTYEVKFDPGVDFISYRRQLLSQHENVLGKTKTFDGVTLYLPHKLERDKVILRSKHPGSDKDVLITIAIKKRGTMKDSIHLYNVLFKRIMSALEMTRIGRHYFLSQKLSPIPKYNLEVWPGYVTAIDEYEDGIQLCIDSSHRVLRTITVLEMMNEIIMSSPNNYQQLVVNAVVGQSVLTRYNNRTYRVDEIYWNMNPSSCFGEKEKEISFLQYYKTQYDITIRDKKQPVLVSRMKRLRGEQETEVEICLIPELCYMTGLTDRMRADYMLMKSVAVYTRITPEKRHQSLLNFIRSVNETPKARELLADWGLSLKNETVELQTRQFPAEEIYTGDGELASKKPDFGMDITRKKAYDPRPLENWFLLCTRKDSNTGNTFVETAKRVGPSMGISVNDPKINLLPNDRVDTYVNALRSIPRSSQVQLVVIIFPSSRDDRYAAVKRVTCCDFGIPSQVINSRTLGRPDKVRAIVQKIILQITCKLGGSLWSLKIPMTHAMICGTDVYHDPVRKGKSVGAFISSLNSTCTYWYSQSNYMDQGQELINQFVVCMKNALKKYHEVNGVFPNRIFIYRDGIGDGQLKVSKELEVPQFEACFKRVSEDYNPKLTVFIVQKRINTRIFSRQRDGGLANPPPGTVVDSIVTRRNWADFFLVSQSVREGTVTPTHYIVLHDSSQMKVDQLQRLTYKLCFMYYNWPGGVRVPAPCQYAHKLAYLAGQHLHQPHNQYLSDKLFFL